MRHLHQFSTLVQRQVGGPACASFCFDMRCAWDYLFIVLRYSHIGLGSRKKGTEDTAVQK
jgi:hypothetical protein